MTEPEALERLVRSFEAIACAVEALNRNVYNIRCLMTEAAEEALDEED